MYSTESLRNDTMKSLHIRRATADDTDLILQFIRELACYEKAEHAVKATAQDIHDSLFTGQATAKALICSLGDQPVGFAVYFYNYSTWLGKPGIYLEDLYIQPEHRGAGAGKALLIYLAQKALQQGCGRFEWSVLDWNQPAIDFYTSLGAKSQDEWTIYRLTGKDLEALAAR